MKKIYKLIFSICTIAVVLLTMSLPLSAAESDYDSITKGEIFYSTGHYLAGQPIPLGFDPFGYNYQGHMFVGSYFNVYSGGAGFPPYEANDEVYLVANPSAANHWAWPYREIHLLMKWNDAWLSNKDRDGDGKLDRHYGFPSYIGSGAWETNHQFGSYEVDGETYLSNYFCKIVAAPADATKTGVVWYASDGTEIGPVIWGDFAIIQEVYNDQGTGDHGLYYISPYKAGFGAYAP